MTVIVKCNLCGEEAEQSSGSNPPEEQFYDVGRYSSDRTEQGDICPECMPDEIIAVLGVETRDL